MFEKIEDSVDFSCSDLCGFSTKYIRKLDASSKKILEQLSLWTLISIILCASSTAYLIYKSKGSLTIAIVSLLFLILLLLSLQALLITSSCIELDVDRNKIYKWKPSKFRSYIFILLGLLFSQPLVFSVEAILNGLDNNISVTKLNIQENLVKERFLHYQSEKNLEITKKHSYLSLFDQNEPDLASQYSKKVLIINNSHSGEIQPSLSINLKEMGYIVTELKDLNINNFEFELKKYRDQLNTGDISTIIYSGKYLTSNNKNYLLPSDFSTNIEEAVDIDNLTSSINKKQLLMSSFFLNLQKDSKLNLQQTSNLFKFSNGNLAVINLTDPNSTDSNNFSRTLEQHLSNSDDIQNIYHQIYLELSEFKLDINNIKFINKLNLPIFLNGRPDLRNTRYSRNEILNILPKEDQCTNYSLGDNKLISNCLRAEIKVLENEKSFLNDMMIKDVKKIEDVKQEKLLKPSLVLNYFGDLWNQKVKTILYSLIAIFFISGGFIFRDRYFKSINNYEYQNYRSNRLNVLLDFREFRNKTQIFRASNKSNREYSNFSKFHHPLKKYISKSPKINRDATAIEDFHKSLKKLLTDSKRTAN